MRKNILHSLLFLLPLTALVVLLGPVFAPKNNTSAAGMLEADPIAILSQPENSIDLLFLGDSEAYSGFVPMELWQDYGTASFVWKGGRIPHSCSFGSRPLPRPGRCRPRRHSGTGH